MSAYNWDEDGEHRGRRLLIVALIIVGLVALGTWGGVQIGSTSTSEELATLKHRVSSIESEYTTLLKGNVGLQSEMSSLQGDYSTIQSQYEMLEGDYGNRVEQLARTQTQTSLLQGELLNLQGKYVSLAKTKAFEVDDSLHVSFNIEEEFLSSQWIAGEVTNSGSTAVEKVYVFIFRYSPEGVLTDVDLPPTVVTDLVAGETAHFSFSTAGEAFKIMVIGNH